LTLAREIVAGRRNLSSQQLYDLATELREANQIGYSRRILGVALASAGPELRNEIQIKLALSTYKDPDLPVDDRLKKAETMLRELLDRPATLTVHEHQEALGILGAVYKQRWSVYGHKDHLEKALLYYRAGYDLGIQTDFGYTAINTAFVLDLLAEVAHVSDQTASAASQVLHQEASKIREEIVTILPGLAEHNRSLEDQWWFDCTIGEAYLGLRRFEDARTWMKKAAAQNPENWRLESTVRQSAHIVRLQAKEDGLPLGRLNEAPGFAVLYDLVGGSAEAASSFFLGKVGVALSGGGFRASLYHIGVLARLAELDMLRHVEVISCVSGGSILGAYYYLEVRNLLQTKTDAQITRDDYIAIVKNIEKEFVAGVQRNIRMRMMLEPGSNWKVLTSHTSTTTDRLADIYERDLYARIRDEKYGTSQRFIQDLLITPAGTPPGASFDPRYQNWRRMNKVPILILNATTLNTCHAWQFTATFMGEPPVRTIDSKIDGNDRLRRMYYSDAPPQYRRIRLGQAVAASSCVPGLFDPLVLDQLYPDYVAKMVDGGVYDNQGAASLLEQDCTVLLVSDASGQTAIDKDPGRDRIGVSVRTNSVLMARGRQEQYQLLSTLLDAGLLRGVAYVHLKKDLDAEPVDWLGCPDPSTPEPKDLLTTYGIRKDIQRSLAAIRTDLDSFSDAEADALMLSGYQMMTMELQSCIKGFPVSTANPVNWRFRAIEKLAASLVSSSDLQSLQTTLDIAHYQALKPYRLSRGLRALTWIAALLAVVGVIGLVISARDETVRLMWLLIAGAIIGGSAVVVKLLLRHVLRNPNPLWQCALAFSMIFLGAPLIWIMTRWLDPIYLRSGPRYRS
jgi:predicted acylesterase/phospholipase RssA